MDNVWVCILWSTRAGGHYVFYTDPVMEKMKDFIYEIRNNIRIAHGIDYEWSDPVYLDEPAQLLIEELDNRLKKYPIGDKTPPNPYEYLRWSDEDYVNWKLTHE